MGSNRIYEPSNGTFKGQAEYHYVNPVGMAIEVYDPTNLYLIAGRAMGKTTSIQARRSIKIAKAMPGAYFAFVGDYYSNLLSNTVPSMIKGWNDIGLKEGVHYVLNERPPDSFAKPYKKPMSYKHTISFYNGCFFKLASMDVVSSMAGDSYQHIFGDEVKYFVKEKIDKLLPAARGEGLRFGHSHYYLGKTFTTDMPNILNPNEFDWILDQEKNMDPEKLRLVLHASVTVNEIKEKMMKAYVKKDQFEFDRQKRSFRRWNERLAKVRLNSTLFLMVSTFANADILRLDYYQKALQSLGPEGFRPAILTMKHEIKQGEKFYPYLTDKNFFDDGLLLEFFDGYGFDESKIALTSDGLRYIRNRQKLEAGMDFGDMNSMVIGQEQGWVQRILKNLYTLEQNESEMAEIFRDFFGPHKMKVLDLYYDRSGNQNSKTGNDRASAIKNYIEKGKNDVATGWKVNLMNIGQRTIYQEEEFYLMKDVLSETNTKLPKLLIDRWQCKELKSSMEVAKQIIKPEKKTGIKRIHKDKSSESIPMARRPMWSTNLSDSLKYYMCRTKYMNIVKARYSSERSYAPQTF